MRIVQVCPRYHPHVGGVETVVKEISERMVKQGYSVDVITTDPTGTLPLTETINGVNVFRCKSFAPGDAYFVAPKIIQLLRDNKYDIIHAHSYHAFPALFAAFSRGNSKFVFSPYYHGKGSTRFKDNLHKLYKPLGGYVFDITDVVICISNYEYKLVKNKFKNAKDIRVITNGINKTDFKGCYRAPNKQTILSVGRLEEYKGIQFVLSTLQQLKDYKFVIVGKGEYGNELMELAKQYNVQNRIVWYEYLSRSELITEYAHAGVFISLSDQESFGITVAEALYAGIPSVVCTKSALQDFVDNKNCFGVNDREDVNEVANAIKLASDVKKVSLDYIIPDYDEVVNNILKIYITW